MQEQYVIVGRETFRTSSHFVHTLNYRQIKHTKAFDCVDHNKLENSERGGNTRPPYLPPEKPVCRSRSNS